MAGNITFNKQKERKLEYKWFERGKINRSVAKTEIEALEICTGV